MASSLVANEEGRKEGKEIESGKKVSSTKGTRRKRKSTTASVPPSESVADSEKINETKSLPPLRGLEDPERRSASNYSSRSATNQQKSRRKERKKPADSNQSETSEKLGTNLVAELEDIPDDVIDVTDRNAKDEDKIVTTVKPVIVNSQLANRICIERPNHFSQYNDKHLSKLSANNSANKRPNTQVLPTPSNMLHIALNAQKAFKIFSLILHGILPGAALLDLVIVYSMKDAAASEFLKNYSSFSLPMHSVYYFILTVALVSSFDKFDIAHPAAGFLAKALTLRNGFIAAVFLLISLLSSLSQIPLEDEMWLYFTSGFITDSWGSEIASRLVTWRAILLLRTITCLFSWFITAGSPSYDYLSESLKNSLADMKDEGLGEKMEENPV